MDFLFSNFPPVKTQMCTFSEQFYSLIPSAQQLDIAVGYITSDSLIELKKITELNNIRQLNLVIGMHYWEKFTQVEYQTALDLNQYLTQEGRGEVSLVTPFRFHGKMYSYSNAQGAFAGIMGSNNLSAIVEGGSRIYEASTYFDDVSSAEKMKQFISDLKSKASTNINDLIIDSFKKVNKLLDEHEHVEAISDAELLDIKNNLTNTTFEVPLKGAETAPQSNLNVFFGKGREGKNGLIKPRHWYETELIVTKNVTSQHGYPKAQTDSAVFDVVTDDGFRFTCKVSGDYSKNFRSENDLKILGKWIKGRLENAGVLAVGQPVTADTFQKYGRSTFTLIKTKEPNLWFLDFGVR